jgi:prepilin-type processing-associated H-X9-DG protein
VGSYAVNGYFYAKGMGIGYGGDAFGEWFFVSESQIARAATTPILADGTSFFAVPEANDYPATNLVTGGWVGGEMCFLTIPRHGKRPTPVPTYWPWNRPLPGAINVAFFDGHVEPIKLDNLWQLYWHMYWQAPIKRPGLQ